MKKCLVPMPYVLPAPYPPNPLCKTENRPNVRIQIAPYSIHGSSPSRVDRRRKEKSVTRASQWYPDRCTKSGTLKFYLKSTPLSKNGGDKVVHTSCSN